MVPSSSGLGRLVLIQKIAGSTPAGITIWNKIYKTTRKGGFCIRKMCGRRVVPNFSPSYIKPAGKSHFWNRDRIFSSFISWNVCDKLVSFLVPNSNKSSALSIEVSILFSCKLILTSSASYFANISWAVLSDIILYIFFSITAVLSVPITVNRFFNLFIFFLLFFSVSFRFDMTAIFNASFIFLSS